MIPGHALLPGREPMTNKDQFDIQFKSVDTQMLSALLIELNIARRNARSYPKGHPVIIASLQKVLTRYNLLLDIASEITIGVARDTLIVEGISFEKANPVFRDFARILFDLGIGTLVLRPGISLEELRNFILLLGLRREDVQKHGGIENVWLKARIATLSVRPIRYDLFTSTDKDSISAHAHSASAKSLWERFARYVIRQGADMDSDSSAEDRFDPELVAAILNGQHDHRLSADSTVDTLDTLADLMCRLSPATAGDQSDDCSYDKLGTLVSNLNPDLRRQFLNSSFAADTDDNPAVRELVNHLSNDAVLDVLEDVNRQNISMPPVVVGLLQRLAEDGARHQTPSGIDVADADSQDMEKIRTLFREHAAEEFTPDAYQQKLNRIMAGDALLRLQDETVDELLETLEPHFVESHISEIILQIMMTAPNDGSENSLAQKLGDMCAYFLETGEYEKLLNVMRQSSGPGVPSVFSDELHIIFSGQSFMEEIIAGLAIWGKPRFGQIREMIHHVGPPFVDVLLDQLAVENSMSQRRFIMDRLIEFGPAARDAVIARLSDTRWYFLRNLLIILRSMDDPSIVDQLRPVLRHNNPQVRQEVFKILLKGNDSGAEEQLLRDLDSSVPAVQQAAVSLAAACASPEILKKLVAILNRSGLSTGDCELKSAVAKTLGEIGKVEVLPELAKVLGASSLLNSKQLARLKQDLVSSLEHYPHQVVLPILQRLTRGNDEVARQAAAVLLKIEGRQP